MRGSCSRKWDKIFSNVNFSHTFNCNPIYNIWFINSLYPWITYIMFSYLKILIAYEFGKIKTPLFLRSIRTVTDYLVSKDLKNKYS